jgi:MscS family membrane protein
MMDTMDDVLQTVSERTEHWLRDLLPAALQQAGPLGVERWQWALLALLLPLALVLAYVAASLTMSLLRRASARTVTTLDDAILDRSRAPVRAIWTALLFRALIELAALPAGVEQVLGIGTRALSVAFVAWLLLRIIGVLEAELPKGPWATERPELKALIPLVGRIGRVLVFAMGAIGVVAQFGYSVATLVAGLGIGGIAVALAAQKTLEHMFGSVALGLDQPIRVGDWIKTADVEGAVESIGLRSTRIRTIERSVVTVPNGKLSESTTENFGVRDRFLLRTTIGLEYGSTPEQLRAVRDDLEAALRAHPLTWPDTVVVRFHDFGASSLNIMVLAWLLTPDLNEFRAQREQLYYEFMRIVARHGCRFAFPTQTVHLSRRDAPAPRPAGTPPVR